MWDGDASKCFLDYIHELEPVGEDLFVPRPDTRDARHEDGPAFGGDTLARSVLAAVRTCEGKTLHSLHARFFRPVPAKEAVEFRVTRLKEGRRFAHRRVSLNFGERLLVEVTTCHADTAETIEFQDTRIDPRLPPPEELLPQAERARLEGWEDYLLGDMECRWADSSQGPDSATHWSMWARLEPPLSDNPEHHLSALAWLSDVHSDNSVGRKIEGGYPRERFLSLDHSIWFHRPHRWTDWLAVCSRSPIAHQSRALTQREIFTRDGQLVATIVQEAFLS